MKKRYGVFLALLVCISFVSAIETNITIRTLPWHEVQVTPFDPDKEGISAFDHFENYSDYYGLSNFVFSSEEETFDLIVYVKKSDKTVVYEKYDDEFEAGEPIYLEVVPDGEVLENISAPVFEKPDTNILADPVDEENATVEEVEPSEVIVEQESSGFTGLAILGTDFSAKEIIYYALGIGVLVFIGLWLFVFRKKSKVVYPEESKQKDIVVRKYSDFRQEQALERVKQSSELSEAEERLRQAQAEVARLRGSNGQRIEEAKRKLMEDEQELMRLRRGE